MNRVLLSFSKHGLLLLTALVFFPAGCSPRQVSVCECASCECAGVKGALDLGGHEFPITTSSREAQSRFNRGLTLAYAFSHDAAEKEFREAIKLDPNAAMPWWGISFVKGPHINFPLLPPEKNAVAWEALQEAKKRAPLAGELERRLIGALEKRYAEKNPENRKPLDEAYAKAMKDVWTAFPQNADVGTLYAESMMDLRPWDLWTLDGKPQPGTPLIVETLERTLALNPNHPGANHLYIHTVEASPSPERAKVAADRLRSLVPGASHLVHMPSHIYARLGEWKAAQKSNEDAVVIDEVFRKQYPRPGFYAVYMAHNHHFLLFAAMMQGKSKLALEAAHQIVNKIPDEFLKDFPLFADGFTAVVPEVLVRFGRWEEVLAQPAPRGGLPIATALWRFARATAFVALGKKSEARSEQRLFVEASRVVPKGAIFGNNAAHSLLAIAKLVLQGEIDAKDKKYASAITALRKAAKLEDKLSYDEPPDWLQPVRHSLGAVLLKAGKSKDAEKVYREDLRRFPENGWSLYGLSQSLEAQGKREEAAQAKERFRVAWAEADVPLEGTCFCQVGN